MSRLPDLSKHPHIARQARALLAEDSEKYRVYSNKRRQHDPVFVLLMSMRGRIAAAMRGKTTKSERTCQLIGCSIMDLMQHIEKQFQPGMSWANYGAWEVDHIRPCASFNLAISEQQRECFNWRNLQPLWYQENRRKSARFNIVGLV